MGLVLAVLAVAAKLTRYNTEAAYQSFVDMRGINWYGILTFFYVDTGEESTLNCFASPYGSINGKIDEPIENPTFDMLKEKSLGCLSNILFWNDQQKHVSSRIEKMEHTLLMGDYGTGDIFYFKRVIIVGFKFKFKIKSQAGRVKLYKFYLLG